MTNADENTEAELGLAASISNEWKNSNRGVGANANSMADMMTTFLGSDTLAELVWSPETGLSIKFAEKKPWQVGPSDLGFLRSVDTKDEQQYIGDPSVSSEVVKSSGSVTNHGHSDPPNKEAPDPTTRVNGSGSDTRPPLNIQPMTQRDPQENNEKQEFESVESCKSANFFNKKKRPSIEQQLILGNKRIKKQTDESTVKKEDGSFINWISNMLKGLKNDHHNRRVGFENRLVGGSRETVSRGPLACLEIKEKKVENVVKRVRLYEKVTKEVPKGMFDTIRRLRLSRTDILKWTKSQSSITDLDGFFLRLRLAKWEHGAGESRYYVACITGLQGEKPWKGLKQRIRVKVGGVECFVESQYISNCDFLEDELIAWWQKTSKNGGNWIVKDLKSKVAERRTLGL